MNPKHGGTVEAVIQLSKQLRNHKHSIEIATLDSPDNSWSNETPFKIHCCGPGITPYSFCLRFILWLRSNYSRFDKFIIHGIWTFHSYATWYVLKRKRIPYFIFPHGMLDPWFKKKYPLKHLKKWLFWPWSDYKVLRDAQAVLFTCEEERALAAKSFWLYKAKGKVVGLGIEKGKIDESLAKRKFYQKYPHLLNKKILLFLSRIDPKKGCDLLLQAISNNNDIREKFNILIAGPAIPNYKNQLMKKAQKLGINDSITWPGMICGDLKWGAFFASDAFILPSHQENFGIVVAEALSIGLPVLITNKVNIWREVKEHNAGVVVKDTVKGISKALHIWSKMNDQNKNEMRSAAIKCFKDKFDVSINIVKLINEIETK